VQRIVKIVIATSYAATVATLLSSCNPPKTVYLSNKFNRPITLRVDENGAFERLPQTAIFKDSLQGRRIESGGSIITFGEGDWSKSDIENLKMVLAKTFVQVDGKDGDYRLPDMPRVTHIRLFVEELLVRFREPKQKH